MIFEFLREHSVLFKYYEEHIKDDPKKTAILKIIFLTFFLAMFIMQLWKS